MDVKNTFSLLRTAISASVFFRKHCIFHYDANIKGKSMWNNIKANTIKRRVLGAFYTCLLLASMPSFLTLWCWFWFSGFVLLVILLNFSCSFFSCLSFILPPCNYLVKNRQFYALIFFFFRRWRKGSRHTRKSTWDDGYAVHLVVQWIFRCCLRQHLFDCIL